MNYILSINGVELMLKDEYRCSVCNQTFIATVTSKTFSYFSSAETRFCPMCGSPDIVLIEVK
jgi:rRNA maturation endonuclease Nob1